MSIADLTFNIASGLLTGRVGKLEVNAQSVSGGRGGSKTPGATNSLMTNNFFSSRIKLDKSKPDSMGGTLPLGRYRLSSHESRKNWIRLTPEASTDLGGRAGFAIHGRGSRGSDGCIVPSDFNVVIALYNELKSREEKGLPPASVEVVAIGQELDSKARLAGRLA